MVGKPGLQHGSKYRISAVDQGKKQHHQHHAINQRNGDKAKSKGGNRQQHVALLVEFVRQNAKAKAKDHADGQRNGHGIADQIHAQVVLATQINGHEGQRCATTDRQ